jgi:integrase
VPLLRTPRTLPRVLAPGEIDVLLAALRTHRHRVMVLAEYFEHERPEDTASDRVFLVLRGLRRGGPLSAAGVDQIMSSARGRAGLERATCYQLRHMCLSRLREAGMALEAVQAQAGHRSIEWTRVYVHLANRLLEWEIPNAPARVPVLASDLPIAGDVLPRFLYDAAASKLPQAARADDDRFVRLTVEFLARTGLRKGEYLALTTDAVVQIGSAYWLHVPAGKLHTDRYIPLHPQLKEVLDGWLAASRHATEGRLGPAPRGNSAVRASVHPSARLHAGGRLCGCCSCIRVR